MAMRRVLVFPAGTEIGLEIHAALQGCRKVKLFAAGADVSNHARFVYPEYHVVPNVHVEGWLETLVELCERLGIQYIFPAHDDVIVALSSSRGHIPATLVTSNHDTCITTRSKSATYRRLAGILPVPCVFPSATDVVEFPVLVKPDKGQGSSHIALVRTREELSTAITSTPEPIICEYLPGDEFTVDCFSSVSQGLLFAGARKRRRTRNGISVNTKTEDLPEAWPLAEAISGELGLRGAWFFQLKRNAKGELALLEVAPRIAGAMAAHRVLGVNFPLLAMMELEGAKLHIATNTMRVEMDRALCNRYRLNISFDTVYLDLDETLLGADGLDENVVRTICRCINHGKRIVLLTDRAIGSASIAMKISSFFDEILQVPPNRPRSVMVTVPAAIYVDNNLERRMEVSRVRQIPTFDASMIELLHGSAEMTNFEREAK